MKFFKKVKEIRSREGVLHFERFALIETSLFGLYIHTIHKEDQDKHLHSHPWNFITMVLSGSYIAETPKEFSVKNPGTISSMSRNEFHKIFRIVKGPVKTLFFTYGKRQPWHYLVKDSTVESTVYREMKHTTGFENG